MRLPIIILLLVIAGAGLVGGGYYFSGTDSNAASERVSGIVEAHDFSVDAARWGNSRKSALRLETNIRLDSNGSAGRIVEYFGESAPAYEFMNDHPVGSAIECLSVQHGNGLAWPKHWLSGPRFAMILGSVLIALGGIWFWKFPRWQLPPEAWALGFLGVFAVAGCLTAGLIWPGVKKQVQAASWDLVPYEKVTERYRRSNRRAVEEIMLRYQYGGKTYIVMTRSNETPFSDVPQNATHCRVNPVKPWIFARSWGWRPAVGMALFPIPFLTVGSLGLLWLVPMGKRKSRKSKRRAGNQPSQRDKVEAIAAYGFFLLFIGSMVGMFASACGELWLQQKDGRLFVTIFLLPFVAWVLWLIWRFCHVLSSLWRKCPVDLTISTFPKRKRARKR